MVEEVERDCFARGAGRKGHGSGEFDGTNPISSQGAGSGSQRVPVGRGTAWVNLAEQTQFRGDGQESGPAGPGRKVRSGEVDETNPIPGPRLGAGGGQVRGGTRTDRGADFEGGAWKRPWYPAGSMARTAGPSPERGPVNPCALTGFASICSGECMDLPGGSAPTLIVAGGVVISGWCFSVSY
jgi:hypothetical protein